MIRRATRADAPSIGRVHAASWHFALAEMLPPEELASVTVAERVADWQMALGEGYVAWVAEVGGDVVGFVSIEGEHLTALYVDPPAQGAGVGTALLAAATEAGARTLDVLADDGHARLFYEARGWRDAGEGELYRGRPTRRYVA